ncbi:MAG: ABC transporter ATP-binding protein, partial [Angelakisella sp.]
MKNEKTTASVPPKFGPRGGPGGHGMVPGEKAKDFKGTLRKLFSYIGNYRIGVIAVMVFAILGTTFNIIGPKVLSGATNELFAGFVAKIAGTGGINFARIGQILFWMLCLYVVSSVFVFIQGWLMSGITQRLCFRLRKEMSEKLGRLPLAYFESRTVGEVLSRITNDIDTLGQSLNQSVTQLITAVTTVVGVLIMMLLISPIMTLIALIILPVSALLIGLVVKFSQRYFKEQQEYLGIVNGQVEENYSGHNVVKAFNREEQAMREFDETNAHLYSSAWKSQFLSGLMQPVMVFVGNLGYVGVAVTGSLLAIRGTIQVGDIQAFIQYVKSFTQPITMVAQVSNMLQSMAAAAERVFELLEEQEEEMAAANPADISAVDGSVEFIDVRFGYTPEKIIINDFSCKVQPGQKVAIVGPTGAGKTT